MQRYRTKERPASRRWTRSLLATAAVIGAAFAALPASAGALAVGIADSESSTFTSPLWPGQNVIRLRVIVPYDIAKRSTTDSRRASFQDWLNKFEAFRATHPDATINVGFERITQSNIPGYGHAPDETTYRSAFAAFRSAYGAYFGHMRIDPWNEPNHNPEDGSRARLPGGVYFLDQSDGGCNTSTPLVANCGARMAAYYYRWARVDCPTCSLEAGDFAGTEGYDYIQKYKYHLSTYRPDVWAVHNYSDVATYQISGSTNATELKEMLGELYCTSTSTAGYSLGVQHCADYGTNWSSGELWVTATGAAYSFACSKHKVLGCPDNSWVVKGEQSQCNAAAFIMRFGNIDSRITRVYQYTFMDPNYNNLGVDDETGVVNGTGTVARKAYYVIRNRNQTCIY
jgi:hypothetical protein